MPDTLALSLAALAESIVNTLEQTDYQYTETIDPDDGIYDCDCNSFAGFVLQSVAPLHYAQIPAEPGRPRPRAFEYFRFFTSAALDGAGGWSRIAALADAQRGDIIAWQIPDFQPGQDTGHVVLVADPPQMLAPGVYAVRVYDSAATPHFADTRGPGEDQFPNGAGSGFINFKTDDTGAAIAFQFSADADFVTLPIAIGRIAPYA